MSNDYKTIDGDELNKKLVRIVENRRKSINEEKNIETCCFASK